jgi:hypothetical protein
MSTATAKTHVSRLLMKLSARDRAQLVVVAYETGLARPGLKSVIHLLVVCDASRPDRPG